MLARTVSVLLLCAGTIGILAAGSACSATYAAAFAATAAGDPVTIVLTATLQPGSLVISIPPTEVTLPSPTLSKNGAALVSTGRLQPIAVTDNRSGDPGWTLSGVITGAAPGQTGFDGQDLGWSPSLAGESPGQRITLGLTVKPRPATGSGLFGLDQPQVLAFTGGAPGLGTAHVGATLTLDLPTGTAAGRYSVTLTLTAI
jgi:hypothetical protein